MRNANGVMNRLLWETTRERPTLPGRAITEVSSGALQSGSVSVRDARKVWQKHFRQE